MILSSLRDLIPHLGKIIRYKQSYLDEHDVRMYAENWTYCVLGTGFEPFGIGRKGIPYYGVITYDEVTADGCEMRASITQKEVDEGIAIEPVETDDWRDRIFSFDIRPTEDKS